jgi:hypothetical protein
VTTLARVLHTRVPRRHTTGLDVYTPLTLVCVCDILYTYTVIQRGSLRIPTGIRSPLSKWARMYAPLALASPVVGVRPFSLLPKPNGTVYFLYLGTGYSGSQVRILAYSRNSRVP